MLPFGYGFGQKQLQRLEQSFYKEKSENFIFVMISSKYTKKLEKCCKGIKTQSLKEAYYGINPLSKNIIIERRKKKYDEYYEYDEFEEYDEYDEFDERKSKIKPEDYKKCYYELMEYTQYFFNYVGDKIPKLSTALLEKGIANRLVFILKCGEIIGVKIIRSGHYFPEGFEDSQNNWIPGWHGTKFESLGSIMKLGLKLPGTILPDGKEIKPLEGHIDRYVLVDEDKDWAKGIFVSQSIFYSACGAYSQTIKSLGEEWISLIETRVKMGSFKTHESTVIDYKKIKGEPDDLEFKVEKESDVVVVAVLFLNKKYFKNISDYKEGSVFVSSDEEIFKESKSFYGKEELIINHRYYNFNILEKKNIYIDYIDSKILCNDFYYQQILKKWLKKPNCLCNEKNLDSIRLLYRGSRDGFKAEDFHRLCDKKGETLVIIKSTNNYIFGGYTSINWDSTKWNGKCGKYNNARRQGEGLEFVFTLKNPHGIPPEKFNIKDVWLDHSICCDINLGPIFGCNDIRIENNCNTNSNSFGYYDFVPGEYCFNDTTGKKRMLFTGSSTYKVEEIEVFLIRRDYPEIGINPKFYHSFRNHYNHKKMKDFYDFR